MSKKRCEWGRLESSQIYLDYHDFEWGIASYEDNYLFEMLILESFHCGLSWLLILNKRENFRKAFDNFDAKIIANYTEEKIESLLQDTGIVRNKAKILATIANAKAFLAVQKEFNSFSKYIWSFTNNKVVYRQNDEFYDRNELSDKVAKDLKKRGFKFMGTVTTFSYLEAIGIMNNHFSYCFLAHTK